MKYKVGSPMYRTQSVSSLMATIGREGSELLLSHLYYLAKENPQSSSITTLEASTSCLWFNACLLLNSTFYNFLILISAGKWWCVEYESDFVSISDIRSLWFHKYFSKLRVLSFFWWFLRDRLRLLRLKYS